MKCCESDCCYCYPVEGTGEMYVCNSWDGLDEAVCRMLAEHTGEYPPKDRKRLLELQELVYNFAEEQL